MRILFQGDSITDCGRLRDDLDSSSPEALGGGYVRVISSKLEGAGHKILNRGISGNRVVDLYARWKPDALHLKPDVLSILIGVNDTWHEFNYGNGVEVDRYAAIYRMLLEWTKAVLPDVQLVLCAPFVLPCGHVTPDWRKEIDQRRAVVEALASDFGAVHVPLQDAFDAALADLPAESWAADGVHPTPAGHELLADCWLRHASSLLA